MRGGEGRKDDKRSRTCVRASCTVVSLGGITDEVDVAIVTMPKT